MRNRRRKEAKSSANPAADTEQSHDTMMPDVATSGSLEEPVEALANSVSPPTKVKKARGRTVKTSTGRGGTSRPTRAKRQPTATLSAMPISASSPCIDNRPTDEPTTMDHDHTSGDSNGSASLSASIATPADIQPIVREPWVPTKPARPFDEYSLREVHAAAGVALMKPRARAQNPTYDPRIIICDPPS
jgi:hypothetical protein